MSLVSRRDILQVGAAAAAIAIGGGLGPLSRVAAQQRLTEAELLQFNPLGNVTLLHMADLHGQLTPVHLREPSIDPGIGEPKDLMRRLSGVDVLSRFGIPAGSAVAHALTADDFVALARAYGRIGGLDRAATVVKAVRTERGEDRVLLFDGGDTWQGSLGALRTRGQDTVDCVKLLRPDAMTGHWEFTYGEERVKELIGALDYPFLALNVRDTDWNEPVFDAYRTFEKGGVKVAVLGQAFPFTAISNPRWLVPTWSFGIREDEIRANVEKARGEGAELVVLLSHCGLGIDRKLAERIAGIDVILTAHTHDPWPEVIAVGKTLLVAGGSHGKFIARLDLDVRNGEIQDFRFKLIPLFAEAIAPEPEMNTAIRRAREPFAAELSRVVGHTESLLYRRGIFGASFDDLICAALIAERDAEIALSPGFWWGTTLLPGAPITVEDIYNVTAITYPQVCRTSITGERLRDILEGAADNVFNPDPYYQQGGDMIRSGGIGYTIDPSRAAGQRISEMLALSTGKSIEATKEYVVAGWGCTNEGVDGPPIWELIERYLARMKTVWADPASHVKVVGM
jgi:sulfur-oxidizing protein SoxB